MVSRMTKSLAVEPYTKQVLSLWGSVGRTAGLVKSNGCSEDRGSLSRASLPSSLIEVDTSPVRVVSKRSPAQYSLHLVKSILVFPGLLCFHVFKGGLEGVRAFFSLLYSKKQVPASLD